MTPLRIVARLRNHVVMPAEGYIHLDALLAWAQCVDEGRPPALDEDMLAPVEIPVQRSACGRVHLCSVSYGHVEARETRYVHKRFPVEQWQLLGGGKSAQRVGTSAGPSKSWRVPLEAQWTRELQWYAVGDADRIEQLLGLVGYLGRRRAAGAGELERIYADDGSSRPAWHIEPVEPWGPGFPVVSAAGEAMRPLPMDWPGLDVYVPRQQRLTYPYWLRLDEDVVATPPYAEAA